MRKVTSLAMALLVGVSGCAAIYGPAWQPRTSESETEEAADDESDSEGTEYDEVDPFGTDPDVPDEPADGEGDTDKTAKPAKGAADDGTRDQAPAKPGCAGLDESSCKIKVGCAWDSIKKCVDE